MFSLNSRTIKNLSSYLLAGAFGALVCYYLTDKTKSLPDVISYKQTLIKPKIFFHGSPNKTITLFEPRSERVRDKQEGAVIFASPHIEHAACFMMYWDDSWCREGSFDYGPNYFICKDKERFLHNDHGGAIYLVPSESFYFDRIKARIDNVAWESTPIDRPLTDWVSKKSVKPLHKLEFKSVLSIMLNLGTQVFFVDEGTFDKITSAKDHGRSILLNLESENKKRGINSTPLF